MNKINEKGSVTLAGGKVELWALLPATAYAMIDFLRRGGAGRNLGEFKYLYTHVVDRIESHVHLGRNLLSAIRKALDTASADTDLANYIAPQGSGASPNPKKEGKKEGRDQKPHRGEGARRDGLCDAYQTGYCGKTNCRYTHECRKYHRRGYGANNCERRERSRTPEKRRDGHRDDRSVINIGKSERATDAAEPKTILFVGSGGGEDEQRKTGIRPDGFCNGSFLARRPLGAC